MLTIKFFQVNGNYYAKVQHDNNVVDTQYFYNTMYVSDYIKTLMTWGYSRSEMTFIIDPTCEEYDAREIAQYIEIYAD